MRKNETRDNAGESEKRNWFIKLTASLQRFTTPFLLLLIVLGIGCRFYGLNWDESVGLHPDERFCVSLVPGVRMPANLHEFFDSRISPLNPANQPNKPHFVYGQLPLFIGAVTGHYTGRTDDKGVVDPTKFMVEGRFLAALFDCGTIIFTFLIGRRLFGRRAALLAAALVAGAALHIQQSHYFVVDPFAAFFLTGSFYFGVKLLQEEKSLNALWCGLFFGAALACKISTVLFASALLGFVVLYARRHPARRTVLCAALCLAGALCMFRMGHPMAFKGEYGFFDLRPDPRFLADVKEQAGITKGIVDVPFDVQWIGRTPWLYSLQNLGFWGYGWPFLLSGIAGTLLLVRRPRQNSLLLIGAFFGLVLFGIQGAAFSKFSRYYLPLTPFCALLAVFFWREVSLKRMGLRWGAVVTALSVTLWGLSVTSIYGRPNTRLEASHWIVDNIPPETHIVNETPWDDQLPISWYSGISPMPAYNFALLNSYDFDNPLKRSEMVQKLDAADWIFISSGRSWQTIPRWPQKWPMMTRFYHALFSGKLGFELEKSFTSFPTFGPFIFPDANAEEALSVYDHPVVMLFHKSPTYDGENVRGILESVKLSEPNNWEPRLAPKPDESTFPVPSGF